MKTRDAFALKSFTPAQILQRPYFREFNFDGSATDDEILAGLSYADGDSRQDAETKFDTLCRLIRRASEYLKFVKRHVDRLERYRRASAKEKHAREQDLVKFYLFELYFDADSLLEKMKQARLELDDALKLSYRKTFADRLKTARLATGLTQKKFAALLNLSQNGFSQYETGVREPDLVTLIRLSNLFNCSADWLLGRAAQ